MGTAPCKNHPDAPAASRCAGCAESFCANCLVEMQGQKYCGACKVMALQGKPAVEEAMLPCQEADEALKYAVIGLFCFGFILGPMAIMKANEAKKIMGLNPRLSGSGKATAATIIGWIGLILNLLGFAARMNTGGR